MIETINKIVRTSRQMLNEIGREPTPEELAEKLGMPLEKVRKVLKIAKEPLSLETPVGDEEDSHLGDFIEDKNAILPIDAAIQSNLRETTTRVLASLTPREERVLRMRFGIGMNTDHTLEEVGQQFSVTRERIRQIEAKALRKLKHPSRIKEAIGAVILRSRALARRLEGWWSPHFHPSRLAKKGERLKMTCCAWREGNPRRSLGSYRRRWLWARRFREDDNGARVDPSARRISRPSSHNCLRRAVGRRRIRPFPQGIPRKAGVEGDI